MQNIEDAVARLVALYVAAVRVKDVEAFIALYNPKVRVFDAWGVWSYEGAETWRIAVEGWFSSLGTETVNVSFDDIQIAGTGELASVSAIVGYAAVSAQGEELRVMQNRLSWMLRTTGHVLRIVHEHTSAPMGFEDMKAILRREGNG
ncbi:MAG: nuclear transport factor 2 family protein [Rubrivivax sp.]